MQAPLAISVGDPAGVGPAVTASALAGTLGSDRALVFGDSRFMSKLLHKAGLSVREVSSEESSRLEPGTVGLIHVVDWPSSMVDARAPTPEGGAAQRAGLDAACDAALEGRARALVTGPVSKEAVTLAGHDAFVGQTEHLAIRAGIDADAVTMMFLGPRLKVALVGTHWPIRLVPNTVTAKRIRRTVHHLAQALFRWSPEDRPLKIEVTGLNPHAGEGGVLGDEEAATISPTLKALREGAPFAEGDVELRGPTPAEAAFRFAADGRVHGVVAMFHDQATIASKLLDWGCAVNVTWGLPFIRTSVDHGVAYEAAAAGTASEDGMVAAVQAAFRLADETRR